MGLWSWSSESLYTLSDEPILWGVYDNVSHLGVGSVGLSDISEGEVVLKIKTAKRKFNLYDVICSFSFTSCITI